MAKQLQLGVCSDVQHHTRESVVLIGRNRDGCTSIRCLRCTRLSSDHDELSDSRRDDLGLNHVAISILDFRGGNKRANGLV